MSTEAETMLLKKNKKQKNILNSEMYSKIKVL